MEKSIYKPGRVTVIKLNDKELEQIYKLQRVSSVPIYKGVSNVIRLEDSGLDIEDVNSWDRFRINPTFDFHEALFGPRSTTITELIERNTKRS